MGQGIIARRGNAIEVVTAIVTGNGSGTLTVTELIGKSNFMLATMFDTGGTSTAYVAKSIVSACYVDSTHFSCNVIGSDATSVTLETVANISFNSDTGVISITGGYFFKNYAPFKVIGW